MTPTCGAGHLVTTGSVPMADGARFTEAGYLIDATTGAAAASSAARGRSQVLVARTAPTSRPSTDAAVSVARQPSDMVSDRCRATATASTALRACHSSGLSGSGSFQCRVRLNHVCGMNRRKSLGKPFGSFSVPAELNVYSFLKSASRASAPGSAPSW